MADQPQSKRKPLYDEFELEQLNLMLDEAGLPKVNEFNEPIGTPEPDVSAPPTGFDPTPGLVLPKPDPLDVAMQPLGTPPVQTSGLEELQQFGTVRGSQDELKAQRDFEAAVDDLYRSNVRRLRMGGNYKAVPELADLTFESPDFIERTRQYARQQTIEQVNREAGLVPGFPMEGFAEEGEPQQSPAILGQRLPIAGPADLPGAEEPTLLEALSPQSRVGPVVAAREERLVQLKSADEQIAERKLDPELHIKFAEKQRLEALKDQLNYAGYDLTPEQQASLSELTSDIGTKKQFDDIAEIGQIRAFNKALDRYMLNESVARTMTKRQAAQVVGKEIEELKSLMSGTAKPSRYKKHVVGTKYDNIFARAFAPQITEGKVPILTETQKVFFEEYAPILEQANIDLLPYQLQQEEAQAEEAAPGALDDFGEARPTTALDDKPAPISKEEAQANYKERLDAARPLDFYAVDFWADPEKYANSKGIWSWFNQSYPSGASVEGPGSVLLRWVAAPFNFMSTELYETSRGRGVLGALGLGPAEDSGGLREPTELEKIAHGMNPKYAGHPYLRAIAENRFIGDDIYDLYWYNGYKDLAIVPGLAATAADIVITPGIPVTGIPKALSAGAKSVKAAKAVGMPVKVSDVGSDALKALVQSVADTSMALEIASKRTGVRLADPSEFAALRASEFLKGANAYRAAKADLLKTAPENLTPQRAHDIAIESARASLNTGTRGNSFLDYAATRGVEWADNAGKNAGAGFEGAAAWNRYRNRIYQVMSGITDVVPDKDKTRRLLEALKENFLGEAYDISGNLKDVLKKVYDDFGPNAYASFLDPDNFRYTQKGIVTALEASPLTKGAWRNLKHVTETLLVDPKDLSRLVDLVVKSPATKTIKLVQDESEAAYGLHRSLDQNIAAQGGQGFTPKVGTFRVLNDEQAEALAEVASDLRQTGYLSKAEYDAIDIGLKPARTRQFDPAVIGREAADIVGLTGDGFGKVISTDNMRRLLNASIEQVAFNNKIGVTTAAFEQAATATKTALRKPLEARHLAASWPMRVFSRVWPGTKDRKRWSLLFPKDTPLNVITALERLRGKLSQMNVGLRRDIKELMGDTELQRAYFTDAWLASNKVSRDDAIVALALGPRFLRPTQAKNYQQSILSVMTAKADDLSMDFLDAFKPASIQRSDISSAMSATGKQRYKEIFSQVDGVKLTEVNGADDFVQALNEIDDRLRAFIQDPVNFKDPKFILQTADADFPVITAGFYYIQKQRQLRDETLTEIALSWPGASADEVIDVLRLEEGQQVVDDLRTIFDGEFGTPGQMISKRLIQITSDASASTAATSQAANLAQLIDPDATDPELADKLRRLLDNPQTPDEQRLATSLTELYDSASEVAETIISSNRLNASTINQNLGFFDTVFDALSGVKRGTNARLTGEIIAQQLQDVTDDPEFISILSDALMGVNRKALVDMELNRSQSVIQIRQALLGLFDSDATTGYKAVKSVDTLFKWYTRSAYQQILAGRPAFHAVNVATGPLLVWGTVGGRAAFDSVWNAVAATRILVSGRQPWTKKLGLQQTGSFKPFMLNKVAVTDPFGRVYTYGDVYRLAFSEGALRSRTSVQLSATQYADMLNDARLDDQYSSFIAKGMGKLYNLSRTGIGQAALGGAVGAPSAAVGAATAASGVMGLPGVSRIGAGGPMRVGSVQLEPTQIAKFLTEMTEVEDNVFRLATVIGALKRGDDPIQALGVGKAALLDYGSLLPAEKWAMTRFAMFYSFWRLNAVNSLTTMIENPKRLVNIQRALQGGTNAYRALAGEDNMEYKTNDLDFYKHSFMLGRPILNYVEGADRQSHYRVLPGVPILDGMTTVAQLMFAPGMDAILAPIRSLIAPLPAALAGKEPSYQWSKKYVDPRDMYVLDKTWWGNYFWSTIIGEEPVGRPALQGQEAWQGQEWTLSEQAMKRYLQWKNGIGQLLIAPGIVTNSSLPITLIPFEDGELTGRRFSENPIERLLSASNLVKDIGTLPQGAARTQLLKELGRRVESLNEQLQNDRTKRRPKRR